MERRTAPSDNAPRRILLARAADLFASKLTAALQEKQFDVVSADRIGAALQLIDSHAVTDAIVDVKLAGETCLPMIRRLRELNPKARVLVVTAYPSIATAVQAIKLGACDYLPMPVDPAEVVATLIGCGAGRKSDLARPRVSLSRLEWEHINRVLTEHRGNISAAARHLGMHRRTLQRKLHKHPVGR